MNAAKLFKCLICFVLVATGLNILFGMELIRLSEDFVSNEARKVSTAVFSEGCLPVDDILEFEVYEGVIGSAGMPTNHVENHLRLKKVYLNSMLEELSRSELLGRYLFLGNDSIRVIPVTRDGKEIGTQEALSYANGVERGQYLKVTVSGKLKIPMMMYIGWEGGNVLPTVDSIQEYSIIVSSERFRKEA